MAKTKIRNVMDRTMVISIPDIRLRKELMPGQIMQIDEEKLSDAMSYRGFESMIRRGYLRVEKEANGETPNVEIFEDQGIDLEENQKNLSLVELKKLMAEGSDLSLKLALKDCSKERIPVVMEAALQVDGLTYSKIQIIDEVTGKDFIKIRAARKNLEK